MKISYNWLKNYIPIIPAPDELSAILTNCGLEVEGLEKYESVKGGLEGVIIAEVKSKTKHPDADRLSCTTVDIGNGQLLSVVCGAANVAEGQKVLVALPGSMIYSSSGEVLEIKKSKIRGQVSEGMICAEDEVGLGTSHDGILVLDPGAEAGTPAHKYFNIEKDTVIEIGLTPNRADAASHIGVARDVIAVYNAHLPKGEKLQTLRIPGVDHLTVDNTDRSIEVVVEDTEACPRYSGLTISGIRVQESPDWLKHKLKAIGVKPINNIVDVTNFVLHESGLPLHAFDADQIKGNKIVVKKLPGGTKFVTLDNVERELLADDLMICNAEEGMCIAGVYGGLKSGITEKTQHIFLESAYFNPVSIRKTSKHHGLKTDASFRFERGTDPNNTLFALKRAAMLIQELAGGNISSDIIDHYPNPVKATKVAFSYNNCDLLVGKQIEHAQIKTILHSLGIGIQTEGLDALLLSIPTYKVDVLREVDVVEEILRIYGYNAIEVPSGMRISLSHPNKPDKERIQDLVSDLLSSKGFTEILSNSLTSSAYTAELPAFKQEEPVKILNPLSSDLDVLRSTLLFSGLEAIAYNQNRKSLDLKLYEFGKSYHIRSAKQNGARVKQDKGKSSVDQKYKEVQHLALFLSGRKESESWNTLHREVDFFELKGAVQTILSRLGIDNIVLKELRDDVFVQGLAYEVADQTLVNFGKIKRSVLKLLDIKQDVYYADFFWDNVLDRLKKHTVQYKEVSRFPEVRRDLALLLDKAVKYEQLELLAYQTEKTLLKEVSLFDVYEGDKLEAGKKSYALSFILQDENNTLTDKQVDQVMEKLMKTYQQKLGAVIR